MTKSTLLTVELLQACELLRIAMNNKNAIARYENSKKSKWTRKPKEVQKMGFYC